MQKPSDVKPKTPVCAELDAVDATAPATASANAVMVMTIRIFFITTGCLFASKGNENFKFRKIDFDQLGGKEYLAYMG